MRRNVSIEENEEEMDAIAPKIVQPVSTTMPILSPQKKVKENFAKIPIQNKVASEIRAAKMRKLEEGPESQEKIHSRRPEFSSFRR